LININTGMNLKFTQILSFSIVFLILFPLLSRAHAEEVLIYIDNENKIQVIDADLEKKLNLFPDYKDFIEARIFRISEEEYLLEIVYKDNGNFTRKKIILDENSFQEFKEKFNSELSALKAEPAIDQEGRYTLLVSSTIFSFSLYGTLAADIMDITSTKNIIALQSLSGSIGFFLPFWFTSDKQITEASAFSYIYGTSGGAFHGFTGSLIIQGEDMGSNKLLPSLTLGLGLAEGIGAAYLADKYDYSTGKVDIMATGYLWCTVWTFETMFITTEMKYHRATGAALFAGSLAGMYLGYRVYDIEPYTRGDVIVHNDVMVLGAYVPLAIADLSGTKSRNVFIGSSLAGSLIGSAVGFYFIKDREFTTGQAGLVSLGEVAGGLLGFGIAKYFSDDRAILLTSSSAGAMLGFAAMYYIFRNKALSISEEGRFNIRLLPYGLIGFFQKPHKKYYAEDNIYYSDPIPLLVIEYKFN
jgi:hypothetical protein